MWRDTHEKHRDGILFVFLVSTAAFFGQAPASETGRAQIVIRNGEQVVLKDSAQYFPAVYVSIRSIPPTATCVPAWAASPSSRERVPTGTSILWVNPVQEIRPGDVVLCPVGGRHRHGASPDSSMTHISICEEKEPGKVVEWLEEVTGEQYNAR